MRTTSLVFLLIFVVLNSAHAVDSRANREAMVAPRTKRFFRSNSAKSYFSLGGGYSSDYNSKYYKLNSRYLYQSDRRIHEANFEHNSDYGDSGSGNNKQYNVKKSELYDLMLASKARIGESRNYGVLFHRTIYDKFSKFGYDTHTAAGVGRMFFNEALELDISLGYHDIKAYGQEVDVVTSMRSNFKITKNLTLIQRGFWFFDHESMDNQLKTSLVYRLNNKMSFEVRHNFEKRRYEEDDKNRVSNYVNRDITIGMIFDLD